MSDYYGSEPDPAPYDSLIAFEACDGCGQPFEVDTRDERPELILCPSCVQRADQAARQRTA